jgi:hypothetical protein
VQEKLPPGIAAVLINRNHSFRDLVLPIGEDEKRLLERIDGRHTAGEIARGERQERLARAFFARLWQWDQAVFEIPGAGGR